MPITIPKPILLLPKVPIVVVVGLLAAQFLIFHNGDDPESKCTLKVEQPHYSTSLKESQNVDAIKLNITSTCNVPQSYTKVNASIQKIENNREVTVRTFLSRTAGSSPKFSKTAVFRNIFATCARGIKVAYRGTAEGYVLLKNGQKITVSGSSGKYEAANCSIGAQ